MNELREKKVSKLQTMYLMFFYIITFIVSNIDYVDCINKTVGSHFRDCLHELYKSSAKNKIARRKSKEKKGDSDADDASGIGDDERSQSTKASK